ncbi:MAG: 50S ribosomal protein L10 [Anaerolineales bacterium]|nr:50S ribosomal protein L10 [Chloroflexota bacterium]MBL6981244.1 50S ribosomal protein L10 [Anaerolineales bacterium]
MAISKEQKQELVKQYGEWIEESKAVILTKYIGLSVPDLQQLRSDIREAGGEFHIVKNTLAKLAVKNAGLEIETEHFLGDTAFGFAFDDAPGLAKAIVDFADESDFLDIKAGYLGENLVSSDEIIALSKVPPLPVLRAQLLSTILAPATKLTRILAEPGRQVAGVLKAYSDAKAEAAPEAA